MGTGAVELSEAEARLIALRGQRFGQPLPRAAPRSGQLRALLGALGAVQLDAVNVLTRSHYLAVYSRLGPYPAHLLDDLVYGRRAAFEYWGHAASFLSIELHPALRWRMTAYAQSRRWQEFRTRVERERPGYLAAVQREIADRGPLTFGDLSDPARREKAQTRYAASSLLWYRWSDGKTALEGLFDAGILSVAGRRGFERLYDLTERVVPPEVLSLPTPPVTDAQRALVQHAAGALGVATARDVADYFRLPVAATRARLRELVDSGDPRPARVRGWPEPVFLDPEADARPVAARALLSPFDSLLWQRDRVARLFRFRHSFELYVKAPNRRYGYYVLPFLLGDAFVGRVDLKADRARGRLLVLGAYAEPAVPTQATAAELATELRRLAGWLELDAIELSDRGDLAANLRAARP